MPTSHYNERALLIMSENGLDSDEMRILEAEIEKEISDLYQLEKTNDSKDIRQDILELELLLDHLQRGTL